ncbi:MAG TPA: nitrate reductase [Planctomycetota bacterium]|nr:nitrate reductase [Planctomycetota bacterium]
MSAKSKSGRASGKFKSRKSGRKKATLAGKVTRLIRQWDGALTRDLVLRPAGFGLGHLPERLKPDATTNMVCGYCSTGCGLNIHLKDGVAIGLTPSADYPVNLGVACPKGWEALEVLKASDRATTPLLRNDRGTLEPVGWDLALNAFCARFKGVQARHGPESLAWLGTGQIVTEELALLGALAKFGMGVLHGDGNTRQCMATAAVAYKQSFGFDAPPFTYKDFEESDAIFLVGSNLCIAHPIMWERVLKNKRKPRIVVVDPRTTETALAATDHVQLNPKSDLHLFYGLAHILIREGWIKKEFIDAHTTGFADFAAFVSEYTPTAVSERTGIAQEKLLELARVIHQSERVSFWWTMGVNQSYEGVRAAQSLINLALMAGHIGRPGTGANSITGQCNAMGSRLFSNTTGLLGGRDFTNAHDRENVAALLNLDVTRIPAKNSWAYHEIIEGIRNDKIKGLWMVATNAAHSWINQNDFKELVKKLDFFVVQDMYFTTETAALAHLVLPAAGWGEKEGTFINSERRFGLAKKVAKAPGQALSDFAIFKLIAHYWGCGKMFDAWANPEAVFQIMKTLSKGQPCDISGIADYRALDEQGGIQWPYPEHFLETRQERRLFEDGAFFTPDKRARFLFEAPKPMPEPPDEKFPLLLLTGRGTASQWHTQTRTKKSAVLRKLYPQNMYVELSAADAKKLGVKAGQRVKIASRRGEVTANAVISNSVKPGQIFLPMHYESANQLTFPSFDPYSKQPSYKACAVRVEGIEQ